MVNYLLDTNIISAVMFQNQIAVTRFSEFKRFCSISSLTQFELHKGMHLLPNSKKREFIKISLNEILIDVPVLPYDKMAANWHSEEWARLQSLGKKPPTIDSQIAAVAASNELVLVTDNIKDFQNFRNLKVANWLENTT